jgi:hypothetical protein
MLRSFDNLILGYSHSYTGVDQNYTGLFSLVKCSFVFPFLSLCGSQMHQSVLPNKDLPASVERIYDHNRCQNNPIKIIQAKRRCWRYHSFVCLDCWRIQWSFLVLQLLWFLYKWLVYCLAEPPKVITWLVATWGDYRGRTLVINPWVILCHLALLLSVNSIKLWSTSGTFLSLRWRALLILVG